MRVVVILLVLCLTLAAGADDHSGHEATQQTDEDGEGCAAAAEPNDVATVFRDEANPVLFIAVGFCPRAERARAAALLSVDVDLTLEPGSRRFQWSLVHGIDEYGVELELPSSLPDEQYRGNVGLRAPYNLVLPVRFNKLSTSERRLQLVFPVPGFVFGTNSQNIHFSLVNVALTFGNLCRPPVPALAASASERHAGPRTRRARNRIPAAGTHARAKRTCAVAMRV